MLPTDTVGIELQYEKSLDLAQGKEGKLRPVSVTCDQATGEISVTESRRSSVHTLNRSGIETFVTSRFAALSLPMDATADAQGRLVCISKVSGWNDSISRLNIYGEPDSFSPETPVEGWNPSHLTITRDGHYLSLDGDNGFLAKHDSRSGRLIWTSRIGDESLTNAHFGRPHELPSGNILVPGGSLSKVFLLSPRGEIIESFGRFGSAPGRLIFPIGIASGPEDTILVLDRLRHKILVFNADFVFQAEFGSLGSGPGQFYHPVSMAADEDGLVYVAQGYKGRVQVFNILGDKEN